MLKPRYIVLICLIVLVAVLDASAVYFHAAPKLVQKIATSEVSYPANYVEGYIIGNFVGRFIAHVVPLTLLVLGGSWLYRKLFKK